MDPSPRTARSTAVTLTVAPACGGSQVKAEPAPADPPTAKSPAKAPAKAPAASPENAPPPTNAAPSTATKAGAPASKARPDCSGAPRGIDGPCCEAARTWCKGHHAGDGKDADTNATTCWMAIRGCTPWGPPAPPKFEASTMPRVWISPAGFFRVSNEPAARAVHSAVGGAA